MLIRFLVLLIALISTFGCSPRERVKEQPASVPYITTNSRTPNGATGSPAHSEGNQVEGSGRLGKVGTELENYCVEDIKQRVTQKKWKGIELSALPVDQILAQVCRCTARKTMAGISEEQQRLATTQIVNARSGNMLDNFRQNRRLCFREFNKKAAEDTVSSMEKYCEQRLLLAAQTAKERGDYQLGQLLYGDFRDELQQLCRCVSRKFVYTTSLDEKADAFRQGEKGLNASLKKYANLCLNTTYGTNVGQCSGRFAPIFGPKKSVPSPPFPEGRVTWGPAIGEAVADIIMSEIDAWQDRRRQQCLGR